jgi:hypothetical protein
MMIGFYSQNGRWPTYISCKKKIDCERQGPREKLMSGTGIRQQCWVVGKVSENSFVRKVSANFNCAKSSPSSASQKIAPFPKGAIFGPLPADFWRLQSRNPFFLHEVPCQPSSNLGGPLDLSLNLSGRERATCEVGVVVSLIIEGRSNYSAHNYVARLGASTLQLCLLLQLHFNYACAKRLSTHAHQSQPPMFMHNQMCIALQSLQRKQSRAKKEAKASRGPAAMSRGPCLKPTYLCQRRTVSAQHLQSDR